MALFSKDCFYCCLGGGLPNGTKSILLMLMKKIACYSVQTVRLFTLFRVCILAIPGQLSPNIENR